jgi:hypothetical protein
MVVDENSEHCKNGAFGINLKSNYNFPIYYTICGTLLSVINAWFALRLQKWPIKKAVL